MPFRKKQPLELQWCIRYTPITYGGSCLIWYICSSARKTNRDSQQVYLNMEIWYYWYFGQDWLLIHVASILHVRNIKADFQHLKQHGWLAICRIRGKKSVHFIVHKDFACLKMNYNSCLHHDWVECQRYDFCCSSWNTMRSQALHVSLMSIRSKSAPSRLTLSLTDGLYLYSWGRVPTW